MGTGFHMSGQKNELPPQLSNAIESCSKGGIRAEEAPLVRRKRFYLSFLTNNQQRYEVCTFPVRENASCFATRSVLLHLAGLRDQDSGVNTIQAQGLGKQVNGGQG